MWIYCINWHQISENLTSFEPAGPAATQHAASTSNFIFKMPENSGKVKMLSLGSYSEDLNFKKWVNNIFSNQFGSYEPL